MDRSELIDNYLMDQLSAEEKLAFEKELNTDSSLQNEVDLQKDIINSIQNDRRAQLKARMNNIPVSTSPNYLKFSAIAASVLLIGAGTWVLWPSPEETTSSEPTVTENVITEQEEITPEIISSSDATESSAEKSSLSTAGTNKVTETASNNTTVAPATNERIVESQTTNETINTSQNQNYQFNEPMGGAADFGDEENFGSGVDVNPRDNVNHSLKTSSNEEIIPEIIASKNEIKKYKYDGENLTLVGDYNTATPYVLIEQNLGSENKLYLYFEDNYYELRNTKNKFSKLKKVTNPDIIEELKQK